LLSRFVPLRFSPFFHSRASPVAADQIKVLSHLASDAWRSAHRPQKSRWAHFHCDNGVIWF
jgi:hypothetical protein